MAAVSVIIPVYNVENYVDRCLKSVTAQTFPDIEIIVVNDGSTDGSSEKCIEWAERDDRIIYVSKKNEGAGPARNLGIQMASTEFVAFCDPDDWYDKRYIELMLAKQRETGADIVACGWYTYDGQLDEITSTNIPESIGGAFQNWTGKLPPAVWLKLYRKGLFLVNNIKFPSGFGEDVAIHHFIMTKAKKVYILDQPLYYYFNNRDGSAMSDYFKFVKSTVHFLKYGWDLFVRDNIFEENKIGLLDESIKRIMYWYSKIKDDEDYSHKWLSDCIEAIKAYFGDISVDNPAKFSKRIIGYGALGQTAAYLLPLLENSPLCPTELWDIKGDGMEVLKPDFPSLSKNDCLLCFPVGDIELELRAQFEKLDCMVMYNLDITRWYGYWKKINFSV